MPLKVILFTFVFLLFGDDSQSQSQFLYSISDFHQIVGVHALNAERVILVQSSDDFPVKIINPATEEVLHRLVRKGKGPGEFTTIRASTFDPVRKVLFLTGGGKVGRFQLGDHGEILSKKETILKSLLTPHSLTLSGPYLDIGGWLRMNGGALTQFKDTITVAHRLDSETLETEREFPFTFDQFGLSETPDIDKLPMIMLGSRLISADTDTAYLVFEGIPRIFRYDSVNDRKPTVLEPPEHLGIDHFRVSYNNQFQAFSYSVPAFGETVLHNSGKLYILYGTKAGYGMLEIRPEGLYPSRQLQQDGVFPFGMQCSPGSQYWSCYPGFFRMSKDETRLSLVKDEAFFGKP